ncbi:MAG: thioredoxin-disulfide reductase [Clostridia bacterium]|nr:thioredoxin-disulfide reductase [Clostridia bacterium]
MYDIIIVGAGPAGMTAALYALRAQKKVLLIEGESYGGQIVESQGVENYPGFTEINGYDLAENMMRQLRALQVELLSAHVDGIGPADGGFEVRMGTKTACGRAVILATGLKHRKLGVLGEEQFLGRGVSFCALCDGGFFRGREVAVVGGGNTALQDALYLSELCARVTLIHRREGFRAEEALVEKARKNEKITILTDTVVKEIRGEMTVRELLLQNVRTKEESTLAVSGIFEAVGQIPQNGAFASLVALDESGYLTAGEDCKTDVAGIFAAGDCRTKEVRQLTTATADGTVAAISAIAYLDAL